MASNYTENYGLCQWEATDQVRREEFNQNNAKVDAALNKQGQEIQEEINIRTKAILEIQEKTGNCKVESSTYIGTGTSGETGKASITFPSEPFLVILADGNGGAYCLYKEMNYSISSPQGDIYFQWSGNTVSWYANFGAVVNAKDVSYPVIAFYQIEI